MEKATDGTSRKTYEDARSTGPKKRRFDLAKTYALASQWLKELAKPGNEGGLAAHEVCYNKKEAEWERAGLVGADDMNYVLAAEKHIKNATNIFIKAKKRRTVPEWSAPCEVWLMALRPTGG